MREGHYPVINSLVANSMVPSTQPSNTKPPKHGRPWLQSTKLQTLITLVLGLTLAGITTYQSWQTVKKRDEKHFVHVVDLAMEQIHLRISKGHYGLMGTRSVFAASDHVNREEFNRLVTSRDIEQEFPGSLGIGYIHRVANTPQALETFLQAARADNYPGFEIKTPPGAALLPDRVSDDRYIIQYIEPEPENRAAVGLEIGAEPTRRQAAEQAMLTGKATLTAPFQLVQDETRRAGFLLLLPIFTPALPHDTPDQRVVACVGWAYMPIAAEEMFANASDVLDNELSIQIFDESATGPGKLIFSTAHTDSPSNTSLADTQSTQRLSSTESTLFGGRTWTITFNATNQFAYASRTVIVAAGFVGLLFTLLIVALVRTLGQAAHKARRLAMDMTQDLRRLALVAEHTTNAVVMTDPQGHAVWCNDGFVRMTGYTEDQAIGLHPITSLTSPDTDPKTQKRIDEAMRDAQPLRCELLKKHKQGDVFWVALDLQPLRNNRNELTGFLMVETNITDQVRNRERIQASEAFLEETGQLGGVGGWDLDLATNHLRWTNQTCRIHELPTEHQPTVAEAINHYAPEARETIRQAIDDAIQNNTAWDLELPFKTAKGRRIWVRSAGQVQSENGKAVRLHGAFQDITESFEAKRRAKEALEQMTAYQNAIDHHSIVAMTDAQGTITQVNNLFCEISGYTQNELVGQNHSILNSSHHPKSFWVQMWKTVANGQTWHGEVCNRHKSGSLYWVNTSISPIRDADENIIGYCAVRNDITDIKRTQVALAEAREAADAASKSKSEFLANMSHEIRTPLTAILGYTDLLREEEQLPEDRRQDTVLTIRRAGEHLLTVINDILDLSKIEAGKLSIETVETPLLEVIKDVDHLMRARAKEKGINLELRMIGTVPDQIMSDPTRLRQILMNLVGNAIKFTEFGRVQISVEADEGIGGQTKSLLQIRIDDTGVGMTKEQADRLFQPFSQADTSVTRRFGGTGLGLTICRRLAGLMGGRIWLEETEPDAGSTFAIELPMVEANESTRRGDLNCLTLKPVEPPDPNKGPKLFGRILLAEDGVDNQRLIAHHLKKAGAEVTIADNGVQALEKIEKSLDDEQFDLLLTDIQMPEMDGYTLIKTLRQRDNSMPIVALTAHAMPEDRKRCLDAGCNGYASKPINRQALIDTCFKAMADTPNQQAA